MHVLLALHLNTPQSKLKLQHPLLTHALQTELSPEMQAQTTPSPFPVVEEPGQKQGKG